MAPSRKRSARRFSTIRIPLALRDRLDEYVRLTRPREACGLLFGQRRRTEVVVDDWRALRNLALDNDEFTLDLAELDVACASHHGEAWAFFHSHANHAYPSRMDELNMTALPLIWLIIGTFTSTYRAYVYEGGGFSRLKVRRKK